MNIWAEYLYKFSAEIIKEHDVTGMEDLQVRNILKQKDIFELPHFHFV